MTRRDLLVRFALTAAPARVKGEDDPEHLRRTPAATPLGEVRLASVPG